MLDKIAGIRGPGGLPYVYQAVLLADAMTDWGIDDLEEHDFAWLRAWFWITSLTEHFRGINGSMFRNARCQLHTWMNDTEGKPSPSDVALAIDPHLRFDFRSARSRALVLMLAALQPGQVGRDATGDAGTLLADHGADAVVRLISNHEVPDDERSLTREPANRFIASPRTARQLREHLRTKADQVFADSHAIMPEALAALRAGDLVTFLKTRRETLMDIEEERANEFSLDYRRN